MRMEEAQRERLDSSGNEKREARKGDCCTIEQEEYTLFHFNFFVNVYSFGIILFRFLAWAVNFIILGFN